MKPAEGMEPDTCARGVGGFRCAQSAGDCMRRGQGQALPTDATPHSQPNCPLLVTLLCPHGGARGMAAARPRAHLCCTEAPSGMRSKEADREPSTAKASGQGRSSTFTSVAALQRERVAASPALVRCNPACIYADRWQSQQERMETTLWQQERRALCMPRSNTTPQNNCKPRGPDEKQALTSCRHCRWKW